jgi:phage-related protein (TIGR01555 family)
MARTKKAARSDGWTNIYTALGSTTRDKRLGARFSSDRLDETTCEDLWLGDDICARIIEAGPEAELRQGFEVMVSDASPAEPPEPPDRTDGFGGGPQLLPAPKPPPKPVTKPGEDDGASEMAQAVMGCLDDIDATSVFIKARQMARAYGGSAILIGADDGQTFDKPLDERRIKSLPWVKVLRPRECWPSRYYRDITSPKHGEVSHFRIQRETVGGGTSVMLEVHESRLIPFYGVVVSTRQRARNRGWGDSVLVRCLEKVQDFQAAFQAAGILVQDFAQAVFKMAGLAELLMNGDDDVALTRAKSIDLSRSVARALIIDKEEEFERKATPVSGLPELLDRLCNRLAAAAKMPVTLLMGQAPAGLNATGASDIRSYYDTLAGERERDLRPRLNRFVRLVMLAQDGPTNGVEPAGWKVKFHPLWQPTEAETATLRGQVATADVAYINAGVLLPEEVALARFGGDEWSMETQLDDEARQVAAQEAEQRQADMQAQMQPPNTLGGTDKAKETPEAEK